VGVWVDGVVSFFFFVFVIIFSIVHVYILEHIGTCICILKIFIVSYTTSFSSNKSQFSCNVSCSFLLKQDNSSAIFCAYRSEHHYLPVT
jgi:hypothetical protein